MNVPKLRFKEFKEDWRDKLLEQLADVSTGDKDTQNRVENGIYPFFVRSQTVERINSYSHDGEAILTSGDGVGVGKNFHYINGKFDYHQRVYCISNFKNTVFGKYVFFYFSEKFNKRVMGLSAKNSVDSVRRSMITEMPIKIPSLTEQTKIARFLTAVDEKIAQLTQKTDLLAQYKKGVMQQIFSQELRFKDDDGSEFPEWEEFSFDDLFFVANNKKTQIKSSDYLELGETPVVDQGQKPIVGYTNNKEVYTDVPVVVFGDHTRILKWIDFVFASGADGTQVLKSTSNVFLKFGFYALCNTELPNLGYSRHMKELKEQLFIIPRSIKEQTKIANFLTAIDDKITQTQAELDAVKHYKQGLLQQMFV